MDQATQIRILRRAMKAKKLEDVGALSKASGVDVSLCRRYLDENPAEWVQIGSKNAPRIGAALGLDPAELIFGRRAS